MTFIIDNLGVATPPSFGNVFGKNPQENKGYHYEIITLKITLKNFVEKVHLKSQILVHEYWTILDRFCVPVL